MLLLKFEILKKRYFDDMDTVAREIVRVLKSQKFAIIVIGSNTNQTGEIRLEQTIIDYFDSFGASLVKSILKPIKCMINTMKPTCRQFGTKGDENVIASQKRKQY